MGVIEELQLRLLEELFSRNTNKHIGINSETINSLKLDMAEVSNPKDYPTINSIIELYDSIS